MFSLLDCSHGEHATTLVFRAPSNPMHTHRPQVAALADEPYVPWRKKQNKLESHEFFHRLHISSMRDIPALILVVVVVAPPPRLLHASS